MELRPLTLIPLHPAVDLAVRRARRLSWIALGAGALSLAGVVASKAFGHSPPWTSWVLAIVLITNPAVYLLSQRWQTFRAARVYYLVTTIAGLVVLAGIVVQLWRR